MRYWVTLDSGEGVGNLQELDVKVFGDYEEAGNWVTAKNKALAAKGVKKADHHYVGVGTAKALRECLGGSVSDYDWRYVECMRKLGEFAWAN